MRKVLLVALLGVVFFSKVLFSGEPIVLIAIEKSASVYIQSQLSDSLGYDIQNVDFFGWKRL